MNETQIHSPDQRKSVVLEYEGEARFGPAFFRGRSTGFAWPLADATVGEDAHWSSDSRFVVLTIFRSQDTSTSPDVELVAIDTTNGIVHVIDRNQHGLIHQRGFISPRGYEYVHVSAGLPSTRLWTAPN
jgi:hypothetical protein